ncbi:hypothetical protein PCANC_21249 [Puccinia coronata f. sp. avenae]|uniref:Uncharacterized protein n=1 Tax=Puccinia coronata f. sp. avenae TaxID=200324 RepID=A0A2N5TPA1_9BASI|nr:hypothetical protein PCANC_21249 [Puccinia coronata f. sp. avenae]PLW27316.1 hypothetical protein PCASD_20680 [Puccinia coronata f. sp. avenae]
MSLQVLDLQSQSSFLSLLTTATMQATFGDSNDQKANAPSGREIEERDARRIEENEQRKLHGDKTIGGSAGRAQVADKDPKAYDVKGGGQGDRLPNEKPII